MLSSKRHTIARRLPALLLILLAGLGWQPAQATPGAPNAAQAAAHSVYLPLVRGGSGGGGAARASSFVLIDAALQRGELSAEAATLYRVYAAVGDSRLPAAYRGNDRGADGSEAMQAAAERWGELSAPTQALLRPFTLPPAYADSWANRPAPAALAADEEPRPLCGGLTASWQWIDSSNGRARFWWSDGRPTDGATARALAQEFDNTIWPKLRGLMGRDNVSDAEEGCNGLGGRLDIYLVDLGGATGTKGWNMPYSMVPCGPEQTFIQINRDLPAAQRRSTLAHEVMHAFQWAFAVTPQCGRSPQKWWMEATATWAMHYVYPGDNIEQLYAPHYLNDSTIPLDRFLGMGDNHPYGAYLLPFYMQQKYGAHLIAASWRAADGREMIEAVNSVLPGGFAQVWPEFALHNWNGPPAPYSSYGAWDALKDRVKATAAAVKLDAGETLAMYEMPLEVPHLAAKYYHYTFPDPEVHGVTFYNGFTFKGSLMTTERGYTLVGMSPVAAEARLGGRVQALLKVNGQWRKEDWSERPIAFMCRDQPDGKVEELLLVFSNSDRRPKAPPLKPQGGAPILTASNAWCGTWQGNLSVTRHETDVFGGAREQTLTAQVTWEPIPLGLTQLPACVPFLPAGSHARRRWGRKEIVGWLDG